jgi:hypothetical protein
LAPSIGHGEDVCHRDKIGRWAGHAEEILPDHVFQRPWLGKPQRGGDGPRRSIGVIDCVDVGDSTDDGGASVSDIERRHQRLFGIDPMIAVQIKIFLNGDLFAVRQPCDMDRNGPAIGVACRRRAHNDRYDGM